MKTKYVCRGLISPYLNFHYNQTMWSKNLHVKVCRWEKTWRSLLTSFWVVGFRTGLFFLSHHLQIFIFEVTVHFNRFS